MSSSTPETSVGCGNSTLHPHAGHLRNLGVVAGQEIAVHGEAERRMGLWLAVSFHCRRLSRGWGSVSRNSEMVQELVCSAMAARTRATSLEVMNVE